VSLWVSYREGGRRMAAEAQGERLAADLAAASRAMSAFVAQAMRRDAPAAAMAAKTVAPAPAERRKQAA
jgi:hypothetical protein